MKRGDNYDTSFVTRDKNGINKWARYGLTWDEKEVHYLKLLFKQGFQLLQLCMILQRPASGVVGKLIQFKLLNEIGFGHHQVACDPGPIAITDGDIKNIISELSQLPGRIPCTNTQVKVQYDKEGVLTGLEFDYSNSPRVVESPFATGGFVKPNPEPFKFQESETIMPHEYGDSWNKAIVKGGAWRTINVDIPDENPTPEHILKKMKYTVDSLGPQGVALISKCSQMGLSNIHRHYLPFKGTTMIASIKSIETKTFINGADATHLTDAELFKMIKSTENEIKDLAGIDHQPQKLKNLIIEKQDLLDKLVKYVDAR